ncbi:MAG: DNA lyase [Blastocatellia bacterium]|nr:MAG: DNA lyase [Blastocatellia bacterium]
MPEGDSIFRTAQALHRALAGSHVSRFESMLPALTRIDVDRTLAGRRVESVTARGKHLLMAFSGDLILHTHMRMTGSWHVYRPGERWRRAARDMRIIIETTNAVAVAFNVPVAEFLSTRELARHTQLRALGPDPLDPSFDCAEVIHRMHEHDREAIGDVLLNQRVLAGLGNVFKSEVLFVAGIDPFRTIAVLSDDELQRVVDVAKKLLAASVMSPSQTLSRAAGRRTTRSLDPTANLWVYGRAGKPCRRCGTLVRSARTGLDARLTYWCPRCQG